MARGKYQRWLEPEGLTLLEGWARDGLTDEQIAHNMGIAYSTLREWKNAHPAVSAALKKGKEVVDFEVENALYRSAIEGNTTAQIFWLKNRRPDRWRDKPADLPLPTNDAKDDDLSRSLKALAEELDGHD